MPPASPTAAAAELVRSSRHAGDGSRGRHQQRTVPSFRRGGVGTVGTTARRRLPTGVFAVLLLLLQTRTTAVVAAATATVDSAADSPLPDSATDSSFPPATTAMDSINSRMSPADTSSARGTLRPGRAVDTISSARTSAGCR